jgi:4-hydroxy-3-methylbut-2-enyl diphosphate reductase
LFKIKGQNAALSPGRGAAFADFMTETRRMNVQQRPAKPHLKILLCSPRGFCAGVVRAIDAVERALAKFGPPVYVRHEIVHNRYVVEALKAKGAVFVEELEEVPETNAPVIFSAHGVPKSVSAHAVERNLLAIDATCPLVTKVHREAEIHWRRGRRVLLVGHSGHPEVVGTMGQLPPGAVVLIESVEAVEKLRLDDEANLAYVTQTTLSLDDSQEIIEALTRRFPHIVGPHKEDICYATTNRQAAVKQVAPQVDAVIVVGSPNSSNSQRLREVAERFGAPAQLVQGRSEINWGLFGDIRSLGITAGASAPEVLVEEIMDAFSERFEIVVETVSAADEHVSFPLPKELRALA